MNPHEKALNSIFDDMDDMESNKMFGDKDKKGVTVTIAVSPNGSEEEPDHDEAMCKGGCAYHKGGMVKMADGGMPSDVPEEDDLSLPPFLRKKRKI